MRMLARVVSVVLFSLGAAHAQEACRADMDKLCSGIPQGGGRMFACLQANAEKLSPACKQRVGAIATKVKEIGKACGDDVSQFCPDTPAGGGRIFRCLEASAAKLSEPCQKTLAQAQEKTAEFKKACGDDVKKFCDAVPKGRGRILACLKSRQADLAPACQKLLEPLFAMPAAAPAAAPAAPTAASPVPAPTPAAPPAPAPAVPAPAPPSPAPTGAPAPAQAPPATK